MLHGWIDLYQAQGMSAPAHVFQDARFALSRTEGWEAPGLILLGAGHRLTILADDGAILWSGRLVPRRTWRRWISGRRDEGWIPENTDQADWDAYFRRHPPLNARLDLDCVGQ